MKNHLTPLLLISAGLLPSLHATTIWHGDPNYSHFSITTSDDVVLRIEGDTFDISRAISAAGDWSDTWQETDAHYDFFLTPDAGWEFTSFNGAATDRGSWRNSYPGGHALETQVSVGSDLSFTNRLENMFWGSGGGFTITYFTPWMQSFALGGSDAHGLMITLDQQLYVYKGTIFDTDVGFGFSMQESTYVSPAPDVPDTAPTLGLLGLALVGLVAGRRKFGSAETVA